MKRFLRRTCAGVVFLCCSTAIGQQLPQFTQYMFNTISINPAYAGSRETLSFVGLHRSQWAGFDGGPQTQTFSVHSPLHNDKIGLGLSFINDRLGYENFSYVYGDFSYTLQVGDNTELALGLKAGFTTFNLDSNFLNDPTVINDPFFTNIDNRFTTNIGVGGFLHSDRWYLGLSAPRIINNDYNQGNSNNTEFVALERVSYYLTGGYVFDVSSNIKFKPAALVKATNGAPLSYDISGNFLFNDKLWLGAAYRINESLGAFGAIADFQINKQLRIGYAYEIPNSVIRPYTNGTHEVLLIFEIQKSKRVKSPRYF